MTRERSERFAGLPTIRVTVGEPQLTVVMLHGRSMGPAALAPFATSLGVGADFFVPQGPVAAPPGHSWWLSDDRLRAEALAKGPRDLSDAAPAGAAEARAVFLRLLHEIRAEAPTRPVAVIGFSQGGMLACDALLRDRAPIDALALLSSSRITAPEWETRLDALNGRPVLVSHGRADAELAFSAGDALRAMCVRAGAAVTWVPFEGGHEIPLVVWRAIRRFLRALAP